MNPEAAIVAIIESGLAERHWQVRRNAEVSGWFADLEAIGPGGQKLLFEVKSGSTVAVPDVLRLASMWSALSREGVHGPAIRPGSHDAGAPIATIGHVDSGPILVVDDPASLSGTVMASANANGVTVLGRYQVSQFVHEVPSVTVTEP